MPHARRVLNWVGSGTYTWIFINLRCGTHEFSSLGETYFPLVNQFFLGSYTFIDRNLIYMCIFSF